MPCIRTWASVLTLAATCLFQTTAVAAPRARSPLAKHTLTRPVRDARVLVKFVDAARVRAGGDGSIRAEGAGNIGPSTRLLAARGLSLRPIFSATKVDALRRRAEARSGRAQPDLLGVYEVRGASLEDARALQALDLVEFVSIAPHTPPPPVDLDPPTPDLVPEQAYLGPELGVDATGAWAMGYTGSNVGLADVEYAWFVDHEEWNDGSLIPEPGQTPDLAALEGIADGNHGTAVAGELIGGDDGYGVTGIAHGSTLRVYPTRTLESGSRRPEAIIAAAADSNLGDIILLEMQRTESITGLLGPAEIEESVWMATRMAADAGIVVVAAAGNGALDLDREELAYYRDRGDSGAIIVGAGTAVTRERLSFSSYGARVDVQGWGESVFTTGYGDFALYGGAFEQSYTDSFAGTSSASPIVAGVAALVQGAVLSETGTPLTSAQMRAVLRGTGVPQPASDDERIGPLPQAPAAIAAALAPQDIPPSIAITTPLSTQTEAPTLTTAIEVDASDDTAFVQLAVNGELQPVIDDVPPFSFSEVVFPEGTWEVTAVATSIWELEATSEPVVLEVGYTPQPGTSTSDAGDSSSGPGGGTAIGDASTSDNASTSSADPTAGSGTSSGGGEASNGEDGGCGCSRSQAPTHTWLWLAVLGLCLRRRRRSARPQ